MAQFQRIGRLVAVAAWLMPVAGTALAASAEALQVESAQPPAEQTSQWTLTVGKSLVIDSPLNIQRIQFADGDVAEAVAVSPREVVVNGKAPGETTLIIWQQNGARLVYDLVVNMNDTKLDATRQQIAREFPAEDINLTVDNSTVFVRGRVPDLVTAGRVMAIASTLGKTVNLLRVEVPPADKQILLKVRFANVDRAASTDLGVNIISGALNQTTGLSTGQFGRVGGNADEGLTLSDALNVFLFRPDLNVAAAIRALQSRRLLEMLAEPNVLAIDGRMASFTAGGEFPFPMVQTSSGGSVVTVRFREYGIRLDFVPTITPRGTIRLQVAPEASSLDFANSVTVQGTTVPALATRKVQTEVELESGQSFVIAGLLDNRMTESLSKMPGLGDIPLLGKIFQSKAESRNNSELMIIVTPEIVAPVPQGKPVPELRFPKEFMTPNTGTPMSQPSIEQTGPLALPALEPVPIEVLEPPAKQGGTSPAPASLPTPSAALSGGGQ